MRLFDATGREVSRVFESYLPEGEHGVFLRPRDEYGRPLRAGVYFARLEVGAYRATGKVTIVR